jgi:hypothetical protein
MDQNDPTQKLQSLLSWLDLTIPTLKRQNPGAKIKVCLAAYNEDGSGQIGPSWDEGEFQEDLRKVLGPDPKKLQEAFEVIDSHPLSLKSETNPEFLLEQLRLLRENPDATFKDYEGFVEQVLQTPRERFLAAESFAERLALATASGEEPQAGCQEHLLGDVRPSESRGEGAP